MRECSRRVGEINKYNGQLEGGLLAYFQLNASNLCNDHERLARALVSLNFDDIKDKLQEVFGILGPCWNIAYERRAPFYNKIPSVARESRRPQ